MKTIRQLPTLAKMLKSGRRINGHYGNKEEFKEIGVAVMKRLAKRLKLVVYDVNFNPGGPAVSGDVTLMGMWGKGNGVYVSFNADHICNWILYRSITHMEDFTGGANRQISYEDFGNTEYVVNTLLSLRNPDAPPLTIEKPEKPKKPKGKIDYQEKLEQFFNYEIPGYMHNAGKTFFELRIDNGTIRITPDDVTRYYAHQANNMVSGMRTIAGFSGDWRPIHDIVNLALEWFKFVNKNGLRKACKPYADIMTPNF